MNNSLLGPKHDHTGFQVQCIGMDVCNALAWTYLNDMAAGAVPHEFVQAL